MQSEMMVSIKRKNYGRFSFSSGCSLNSVEKSYGLEQTHFLTFWLNLKILKNYLAKSEIKDLAQLAMPFVFKKIWLWKMSNF